MDESSLVRLMQLASPSLPVGAYAYSQGLEYAVSVKVVTDENSAFEWIAGILKHSLGFLDIPIIARFYKAWVDDDMEKIEEWNNYLLACRESSEILAEDKQLGSALSRLLRELDIQVPKFSDDNRVSFASMFTLATVRWNIPLREAMAGYLWSWTDNQVLSALKLLSLGQSAGQRILLKATALIPQVINDGIELDDSEIGNLSQSLAIYSALHETQYSKLFRS